MPSVVEICNMALSRIGQGQKIDSLNERSAAAEDCSLFYPQVRDFVLRDKPWSFATKFVALAQVAVNPDPSYAYAYSFPIDCVTVRRIVNSAIKYDAWPTYGFEGFPAPSNTPFRVIQGDSSRLIATSVSPATLEYTARIEDPGFFDSMFVSALAWKLASELAIPLAKGMEIANSCEAAYQAIVNQAFTVGQIESQGQPWGDSSFITGRY